MIMHSKNLNFRTYLSPVFSPNIIQDMPSQFDECAVLESTGRVCMSANDEYKADVYLPVLESFLRELHEHFSTRNVKII